MNPGHTTHRLHFSDLEPLRFEALCLELLYAHQRWDDLQPIGQCGNDGGSDIRAIERHETGQRRWLVQCKRYKSITPAQMVTIVETILENETTPPDVLLIIVACDVSRRAFDALEKYKTQIKAIKVWSQGILEAKLYQESPDILHKYFGVPTLLQSQEEKIKHRQSMKKEVQNKLLTQRLPSNASTAERLRLPNPNFVHSEAIIRSITDTRYPESALPEADWIRCSWYKVELWDLYHQGIEVILSAVRIVYRKTDRKWAVDTKEVFAAQEGYVFFNAYYNAWLPFESIVQIDDEGDGHYGFPHFYCKFTAQGVPFTPYEKIVYRPTKDNTKRLPDQNQVDLTTFFETC